MTCGSARRCRVSGRTDPEPVRPRGFMIAGDPASQDRGKLAAAGRTKSPLSSQRPLLSAAGAPDPVVGGGVPVTVEPQVPDRGAVVMGSERDTAAVVKLDV